MPDLWLTLLKVLHVVAAMMWLGAGVLILLVLNPLQRHRPTKDRVRDFVAFGRRAGAYFGASAGTALLTGYLLAQRLTGTWNPLAYDDSSYPGGSALQVGLLVFLAAFVLGGINGPVQKRLRLLSEGSWGPAEEAQAQKMLRRLDIMGIFDVLLLVTITAFMVIANLGGF